MATIKSTLALNDRMSSTLSSITKAMNSTLNVMKSIKNENLGEEFSTAAADIKRAEQSVNDFNKSLSENNTNMTKNNNNLTSMITGLVSWYTVLTGLKTAMSMSDTYVQTQARLNMINDGSQTLAELEDKIYASSQRARASYNDTADAVAKLQMRAGDAFKTNDETIQFAENLNKIYAIGGTAQQEMSSATLQLSQALGSGVLRGEEFNAVFEAAPMVMQKVADYMGKPIGQLRELAAEGKITADIVKNALLSATDDINAQFEKMPLTFEQAWTKFKNSVQKAFQPLLKVLNQVLSSTSQFFDFLAKNEYILYGVSAAIAAICSVILIYNIYTSIATVVTALFQTALGNVLAIIILIIVVVAALAIGLIYLWNTNDKVATYMLYYMDMIKIGLEGLRIYFDLVKEIIALDLLYVQYAFLVFKEKLLSVFTGIKLSALIFALGIETAFEDIVNASIWMYNEVAKVLNNLGGNFETIDFKDFTSNTTQAISETMGEYIAQEKELQGLLAQTEKDMGASKDKIANIFGDGMGKLTEMYEQANATRAERVANRKKIGISDFNYDNLGTGLNLDNLVANDSSGAKALRTTTNDKLLTDEDIQLLLDVATRDYKLNYQSVTPEITLTFGDIRETADVDSILDSVADKLEEIYDGNLEVAR